MVKSMDDHFHVEKLWVPAGEGVGTVSESTHFLSLADGPATFVEWSASGYKRRRKRVFSGDLWVWPAGQTWWTRREADKACIQLSISAAWLSRVVQASFELVPQVHLRDPLLDQVLRTLATTATLPRNPTTTLYREGLVTTLALHLATHYGQTAAKQRRAAPLSAVQLRRVSGHVSEHLARTISLADLAQIVGLGTSQFSLRFRDTTGQTPYQFVTSVRVERARDLLIAGKHTPAEVAVLTGFADQSHLTRHLRRNLGVTPGALIKQRSLSSGLVRP